MNESLLQFIWQYSLYQSGSLMTTAGEPVAVLFAGQRNTNAGPDFLDARVKIGNTTFAGNIELHVRSSDWRRHGHSEDPAYGNIILHVVYEADVLIDGAFPTLSIGSHIPQHITERYAGLVNTIGKIPCSYDLMHVGDITKEAWLSRLLAERWELKLADWEQLLADAKGDWRQLLYWRLAANFGFKVNADAFLQLAKSLPINILAKHHDQLFQLEALLFGQAGMLDGDENDEYPRELFREYEYLSTKYKLKPIKAHLWKFLRLRPANFPTIRIAQFAALIHQSEHLFSTLIEKHSYGDIAGLLAVSASEYWEQHFRFDDGAGVKRHKNLGASSIENIIVNTIAPIQFLYARYNGDSRAQELAIQLIESLQPEGNSITNIWIGHGWMPANAAQSQAMIQLYNQYCTPKRCLECSIGLSIMKRLPDK